MAELVVLKNRASEQEKQSVLEVLEDVWQQAKDGEIAAVAVAYVRPDRGINCQFSTTDNCGGLLGSIALLNYRICSSVESD